MKIKTLINSLIVLNALFLSTLACGSNISGVKVGENSTSPTSAPPKVQVYKIGDVIQVGEQTIVLNSAQLQGNFIKANFTIENKGSSDLNVSSIMSFTAKDSEGTKLEQDYFNCGSGLDGKVLPGDKLRGDICWNGFTTNTLKIYYEADLFSSGAVVWEITK